MYHINLLKRWHEPLLMPAHALRATLSTPAAPEVPVDPQLSQRQKQELTELVDWNRDVFSTRPGRTHVLTHDIITEPFKKVRLRPYRIPEARRQAIREEVEEMLRQGITSRNLKVPGQVQLSWCQSRMEHGGSVMTSVSSMRFLSMTPIPCPE